VPVEIPDDVLGRERRTIMKLHALAQRENPAQMILRINVPFARQSRREVRELLGLMRDHDVEVVTIGQYLRPSLKHHPVARFWTPEEFAELISYVLARVRGDYVVSTHCHNDLGLAVANSLAAVAAGARQVECAINGLGERAGNAALEEIVMAIHTRGDYFSEHSGVRLETGVRTEELARTSRIVARLTGYPVQYNKAVVGRNAFAHESGIHQHGVLADRETYEIMDANIVGQEAAQIVLGKHSGRHAFGDSLAKMGIRIQGDALNQAFTRFKELADRKVQITEADLEAIVAEELGTGVVHRFDIVSLFPEVFEPVFRSGIVGRAIRSRLISLQAHDLRGYASDPRQVDDAPFGGGPGMVLKPEPIFAAVEAVRKENPGPVLLMEPWGEPLTQALAGELADLGLSLLGESDAPAWSSLRHYDSHMIDALRGRGFSMLLTQLLLVKELAVRIPVREKGLVPSFG